MYKIDLQTATLEEDSFYKKNIDTFTEFLLPNGIPVCIKRSPSQKTATVRIIFTAAPLSSPGTSGGISEVCFLQLLCGNKKYSAQDIYSFEYTQQTDFYYKLHRDYFEYGVATTKDRVLSMMDVLSSTLLNPSMETKDFLEIYDSCRRFSNTSLYTSRVQLLNRIFNDLYLADSYFMPLLYTPDTKFSDQDVKKFHAELLNASRISIIASGNFSDKDVQAIQNKIREDYSSIQRRYFTELKPQIDINRYAQSLRAFVNNTVSSVEKKDASQKSCALGIYPVPSYNSSEYEAYALLSLMLDDQLYTNVKERRNYASSCGTGVFSGTLNTGVISLIDISDSKSTIKTAEESIKRCSDESLVSAKLDYYKGVYSGLLLSSESSSESTCDKMALSAVYYGDPKKYLERSFAVKKLQPQQIIDVFNKSCGNFISWYVIE